VHSASAPLSRCSGGRDLCSASPFTSRRIAPPRSACKSARSTSAPESRPHPTSREIDSRSRFAPFRLATSKVRLTSAPARSAASQVGAGKIGAHLPHALVANVHADDRIAEVGAGEISAGKSESSSRRSFLRPKNRHLLDFAPPQPRPQQTRSRQVGAGEIRTHQPGPFSWPFEIALAQSALTAWCRTDWRRLDQRWTQIQSDKSRSDRSFPRRSAAPARSALYGRPHLVAAHLAARSAAPALQGCRARRSLIARLRRNCPMSSHA